MDSCRQARSRATTVVDNVIGARHDSADLGAPPRRYPRRAVLAAIAAAPAIRRGLPAMSTPAVPPLAVLSVLAARQFGFFSDPDPRTVAQIAATGVGGISMGPYFVQATSLDSSLGQLTQPSPQVYIDQMQHASDLGLRVTLKPMVDAQRYPNGGYWRGYLDPTDPDAWFADYWQRAIQPYLEWCDTLIIYTELATLSARYPQAWEDLVVKVRNAGFLGPISSDSDLSPATTPWYESLNWLGGSFYPAIDTSTDASATQCWTAVADQMAAAHQLTHLQIFMAEVGVAGLPDAQLVRWITTMGEVLGPQSWWAGFSYWRWSQDPTHAFSPAVQSAFRQLTATWTPASPAAGP